MRIIIRISSENLHLSCTINGYCIILESVMLMVRWETIFFNSSYFLIFNFVYLKFRKKYHDKNTRAASVIDNISLLYIYICVYIYIYVYMYIYLSLNERNRIFSLALLYIFFNFFLCVSCMLLFVKRFPWIIVLIPWWKERDHFVRDWKEGKRKEKETCKLSRFGGCFFRTYMCICICVYIVIVSVVRMSGHEDAIRLEKFSRNGERRHALGKSGISKMIEACIASESFLSFSLSLSHNPFFL